LHPLGHLRWSEVVRVVGAPRGVLTVVRGHHLGALGAVATGVRVIAVGTGAVGGAWGGHGIGYLLVLLAGGFPHAVGDGGDDDEEWFPQIISWCKEQLASVNGALKELHRFAHDDGGFKAHQEEVRPRLLAIGDECDRIVTAERKGSEVKAELDRHLWHYVSMFTRMNGDKLKKLYVAISKKKEGDSKTQVKLRT